MSETTNSSGRSAEDRQALEMERLALENQKLKLDLQRELNPDLWSWAGRLSPVLATVLAVAGFLFGVRQYVDQQKASRDAAVEQERRDLEARDRDFMKPLWEKELELYFRAASAAATIATITKGPKRDAAENEFWQLYEGPLIVVENQALSGAMKEFGRCLNGQDHCDKNELRHRSRALGSTIQETIQESAKLRLSDFSKNKFQYHR
jgi:hypothetical protein